MSSYDIQGNYFEGNIEEGFTKHFKKTNLNKNNKNNGFFGLFKKENVNEGFLKTHINNTNGKKQNIKKRFGFF